MRADFERVMAKAPSFYGPYLQKVPEGDLLELLEGQLDVVKGAFLGVPLGRQEVGYAMGKWSPKEMLGHLIDAERIFQYRLLRFARADRTPLPGFEEDDYVPVGRFNARGMEDLVGEFEVVRASSLALVRSLDGDAWGRGGVANGKEMGVEALVWILYGHVGHHLGVLGERYV